MDPITLAGIGLTSIGSLVGSILWFSRLESKGLTNSRDIERLERRQDILEQKLDQLDTRVLKDLSDIKQSVANIEGRLAK